MRNAGVDVDTDFDLNFDFDLGIYVDFDINRHWKLRKLLALTHCSHYLIPITGGTHSHTTLLCATGSPVWVVS
jgi:hypothetical protein